MATKTFTFNNVAGLRRAYRRLPREADTRLRLASLRIADVVASKASMAATRTPGVAKHIAPTIKARRDRAPKVVMGGSTKLPPRDGRARRGARQTVGDVIWGAEFGGGRRATTHQFDPWRGNDTGAGYFLWPTVREESDATMQEYGDALLDAIDGAAR